jgi:hypothetical protein
MLCGHIIDKAVERRNKRVPCGDIIDKAVERRNKQVLCGDGTS